MKAGQWSRRAFEAASGRRAQRGMFLLEAMLGTLLTVAIAAAVIATVSGQRRAAIAVAEVRQATRSAENALTQLQTGGSAPADVTIHLVKTGPNGWQWVAATATCGSHRAELTGLVPGGAIK